MRYPLIGMLVGALVGLCVYGMTQYIPAIGLGPLVGFVGGLVLDRFSTGQRPSE
jgi:hypothetical protein